MTAFPVEDVPTDRVVLRPLRATDVDALVDVADDPLVRRFAPALPVPYTRTVAEQWLTEILPARSAAGDAWFASLATTGCWVRSVCSARRRTTWGPSAT